MANTSLGGIIADSAVLNVPRGQHMNPFQTVLNKQKANALLNQRKAKENSDALTSLDDYVVVDKNFLPSTAKQAVELSRDFNNKAMQLIGTPNAKNKIHDLYVKDYSVQLQMLRGANQAKLDYINADQSGKFNTYPDLAQKFQTSEDYQGINKMIAEKGDNTLLSDGDKQFAFTPKPKFQEGTLFNTQENDYVYGSPKKRDRGDGYDEITNNGTISPQVVSGIKNKLLNDPTFVDTELHKLPPSVRSDPNFDPTAYIDSKADERIKERLQTNISSKPYLQKQPTDGKGLVLNIANNGSATNGKVDFSIGTGNVLLKNTDVYQKFVDKIEEAKTTFAAKYKEKAEITQEEADKKANEIYDNKIPSEDKFYGAYKGKIIVANKKYNEGESKNVTFTKGGDVVNGEPLFVAENGKGGWDIIVNKKIGQEQGLETFKIETVPYTGENKTSYDLKYTGMDEYFNKVAKGKASGEVKPKFSVADYNKAKGKNYTIEQIQTAFGNQYDIVP